MTEDIKQGVDSKKRIRSVAYPSIELEEGIKSTEDLRKKLGMGPYSRSAAVTALGYSGISGASATKIAALVHFGLLSRNADTYRQSPLADRILFPQSDDDKIQAIIEAVKTPKLYSRLIVDFAGKSLPTLLPNVLFHTYGINEKASKNVAATFAKSVEFAGVLKNGVIDATVPNPEFQSQEQFFAPRETKEKPENPQRSVAQLGMSIPLGPDITVTFSPSLIRDLADGKFKVALKTLEELGKKKEDEQSTNDAPDTPVEPDQTSH